MWKQRSFQAINGMHFILKWNYSGHKDQVFTTHLHFLMISPVAAACLIREARSIMFFSIQNTVADSTYLCCHEYSQSE